MLDALLQQAYVSFASLAGWEILIDGNAQHGILNISLPTTFRLLP